MPGCFLLLKAPLTTVMTPTPIPLPSSSSGSPSPPQDYSALKQQLLENSQSGKTRSALILSWKVSATLLSLTACCSSRLLVCAGVQLPQAQDPANLVSFNPPPTAGSTTPTASTSNSSLATAPAGSAAGTSLSNLTSSGVASTSSGSGMLAATPGANNSATSG